MHNSIHNPPNLRTGPCNQGCQAFATIDLFHTFRRMTSGYSANASSAFIAAILRDPTGVSWADALDEIGVAHRSAWAHIHIDDGDFAQPRISIAGLQSDISVQERLLASGYNLFDPRPELMAKLSGTACACWQLMDADAFDASVFVNEFLDRPDNDLRWAMGTGTILPAGSRMFFGVSRRRSAGPYDLNEIRAFDALTPSIISAIELHDRLWAAERTAQTLLDGLDTRPPIIAIDRRGRVAFANQAGNALIEGEIFSLGTYGAVRLTDARAQSALEAAISRTDDGLPIKVQYRAYSLTLRTVPAMIVPVPGALAPVRVIMEFGAAAGAPLRIQLTKREREVADLLSQGVSLPEISQRLHKSIETVRAQLKAAMRKLGVHSQAQMVSALLTRRQE